MADLHPFHAKTHGVVTGRLTVSDDLPPELRPGPVRAAGLVRDRAPLLQRARGDRDRHRGTRSGGVAQGARRRSREAARGLDEPGLPVQHLADHPAGRRQRLPPAHPLAVRRDRGAAGVAGGGRVVRPHPGTSTRSRTSTSPRAPSASATTSPSSASHRSRPSSTRPASAR